MSAFAFLVVALSVWRVTHLVVEDSLPLVEKPREWVIARKPEGNLAYLLGCTYCTSVWVAGGHLAALYLLTDVEPALPAALVAAWSITTAFAETVVDWLDRYGS